MWSTSTASAGTGCENVTTIERATPPSRQAPTGRCPRWMVGVASTYPPGARFMPFTIGIPAIALCLLQLALEV